MGKKIFAALLTMILIFSIKEVVYAEELTEDGQTAQVPVTYTVDNSSFIIIIPAIISADVQNVNFRVSASLVNIRPDEHIEVSIASGCDENGYINLIRQNETLSKATILKSEMLVNGENICKKDMIVGYFKDSDDSTKNLSGDVTISGLKVDENTKSGDYQALVEFRVDIKGDNQ